MGRNKEWLDSLKVGDEVAMDVGSYGFRRYSIATVTKITPTRRISTSNNLTFNADGSSYGRRDSWSSRTYLEPVTDKILEHNFRSSFIGTLKSFKFEELTTEQLRSIESIIKKETNK